MGMKNAIDLSLAGVFYLVTQQPDDLNDARYGLRWTRDLAGGWERRIPPTSTQVRKEPEELWPWVYVKEGNRMETILQQPSTSKPKAEGVVAGCRGGSANERRPARGASPTCLSKVSNWRLALCPPGEALREAYYLSLG